jgi:hypothetical protein
VGLGACWSGAYMESALELSVSSKLHADHFIKQQAHKIEGFRHTAALIPRFGHAEMQRMARLRCFLSVISGPRRAETCRCFAEAGREAGAEEQGWWDAQAC